MKINLSNIDFNSFSVSPSTLAGETVYLINPVHIGCKWNKDNLHLRSVMVNEAGEVISASYPKFFNYNEQPDLTPQPTDIRGCTAVEKLDGSTLIVSQYKGELIVRTRGTTDATKLENGYEIELLKQKYPEAFKFVTDSDGTAQYSRIFEWCTPTNRIVIPYAEPTLYLTGFIMHEDYSMLTQDRLDAYASRLNAPRPQTYKFGSVAELLTAVELFKGVEGVCLYCNNGQNIRKVKGLDYLARHKLRDELGSFDKLVDFFFTQDMPSYIDFYTAVETTVDFETAEAVRGDISRIVECMKEVNTIVEYMKTFAEGCKGLLRKDAAAKILQAYGPTNRSSFCFLLLDGKTLEKDHLKKLLYQVRKNY